MMGFSCMKAAYDHTSHASIAEKKYYYCTRHSSALPTRKSASQLKKYLIKNNRSRSDPIPCLAVMKLARSVFARKNTRSTVSRVSSRFRIVINVCICIVNIISKWQ